MDALKALGLCALLAVPHPSGPRAEISSPNIERWQSLIEAASVRFGVPADWIRAVMDHESAGLTTLHGAPIVSSAGAMGLMQLMPGTWSEMRVRYRLSNDPFDPHDNVFAGTAYLREMFDRYGYPALFAAYHAGPARLDAVLRGEKALPAVTKTYLDSVIPGAQMGSTSSENRSAATSKSATDSLFFVRESNVKTSSKAAEVRGLFVPLASQPLLPRP